MMSAASREALLSRRPGLRPLVITRSTFPGAGSKVGHWLGDNLSTWDKYRASIRTMLAFTSLYQFNMVGSDVCGFAGNTTEELCARWASLGAFSTFYRNHNELTANGQEFYRWASVTKSARKAIDIRYRLMDYIYTAMYRASTDGTPSVAPMLHHYPKDQNAWALELQYFYGPGVLVAPVTEEGATSVSVYLPNDLFYDWYTHKRVRGSGAAQKLSGYTTSDIPLMIKAGVILPLRMTSAKSTTELRKKDFELLIPLTDDGKASGELYLDDGVSIDQPKGFTMIKFSYAKGSLSITGTFDYGLDVAIKKVTVLGGPQGRSAAADGGVSHDVNISLEKPSTTKVA